MHRQPATYIMSNRARGVIYTGATSDLIQRVYEHRCVKVKGFSERYNATRLVWYELHHEIVAALQRESQIKHWRRDWKIALIESLNPSWADLYRDVRQ